MSEWKKVKLGEVCEISAGGDRPQIFSNHRTDKCRIPIYSNGIDNEGLYGFTDTPKNNGNAITITGRGANAGTVFYRKDPFLSIIRLLTLTPNSEIINAKYLFYLLKNKTFLSTGSAQPQITVPNISQFEIEFNPDIETQHRIATILSRYDSLIENYQKQIKLLEEAAQRLYKEWFIDLHFPGHENTKIVDGVPEGWEKKPALDFFEMSIGKTPPRTQKQWFTKGSNGIPWVSISDMKDTMFVQETAEELTQDACENYNIKVVPKGTILLSFKLTVGRVAFAGADVCTNEAIAHFQKEGDEWKAYTLMYLRNYNYDSLGNTSGISKAVNSTIIKNMPFVMPCTAILQKFSQRVLPFIKQTENLQSQIRLLTEARDRLLPKLMSGEITV